MALYNDLLTLIDQYTFGEKITLSDPTSELDSRWFFMDEESAFYSSLGIQEFKSGETMAIDDEIRLCHHGKIDFGKTWITAWGRSTRLEQWIDRLSLKPDLVPFSHLETWRTLSLRPRVDAELTESVTPLEIGLRDSIADQKGCYPGQEVIEKIIALGSPPRRLARIDGEGKPPRPGELILNFAEPAIEIGQVTTSVSCEGKFSALGLLKKIHAKEGLEVQFSENRSTKGKLIQISPYA